MKTKKGTTIRATFQGGGLFPLDMLRYDRCWPSTSADASFAFDGGYRTVRVEKHSNGAALSLQWTNDRWASFGWKRVVEDVGSIA